MIEFRGYLTGAAEQHFHKRSSILGQKLVLFPAVLLLPLAVHIAILLDNSMVFYAYCVLHAMFSLLIRIPKSRKEKLAMTPKLIYIENSHIVCIADKYEEIRNINDVRRVSDYGEFYEIIFPFGKISEKFICQKELLTNGSINKFEQLFKDKIVRKDLKKTGDGSLS